MLHASFDVFSHFVLEFLRSLHNFLKGCLADQSHNFRLFLLNLVCVAVPAVVCPNLEILSVRCVDFESADPVSEYLVDLLKSLAEVQGFFDRLAILYVYQDDHHCLDGNVLIQVEPIGLFL